MKKLVSVFVPYYNDSAFLRECIESILNQSYEHFELILLDHASTDDSSQIAHSFADERIKHIVMDKNLGAGGGMLVREFMKIAKGEFLKPFCADDVMHPQCLEKLVSYVEQNPTKEVVFGNVQYVDKHSRSLHADWFTHHRYFNINDDEYALLSKYIDCRSVLPYIGSFVKREAFAQISLNATFIMVFDMTLWAELLLANRHFGFLNECIANYRIHDSQESSAHKSKIISARSYFESIAFANLFYTSVKDVETLKRFFPDSPFVQKMNQSDTDIIDFAIAHYFLNREQKSFRINAYLRLEQMFSDEKKRIRIEQKFGYGIAEFRKDYSFVPVYSYKKGLYVKHPDKLSLFDISFLLVRKLWDVISLKQIRKRKKYTL